MNDEILLPETEMAAKVMGQLVGRLDPYKATIALIDRDGEWQTLAMTAAALRESIGKMKDLLAEDDEAPSPGGCALELNDMLAGRKGDFDTDVALFCLMASEPELLLGAISVSPGFCVVVVRAPDEQRPNIHMILCAGCGEPDALH